MVLTRISTSYMAVNSIFETWPLDYTVDGWLANLGTGLNRLKYLLAIFFEQGSPPILERIP